VRQFTHSVARLLRDQPSKSEEQVRRERARINRELVIAASRGRDATGFQIGFGRCETPIEQQFCVALFQVAGVRGRAEFFPEILESADDRLFVHAQQPIDRYQFDFLIAAPPARHAEPVLLVVECDDERCHSTGEQAACDAARRRVIGKYGLQMLRFTGREIHQDPRAVIVHTLAACGWDEGKVRFRNIDLWPVFNDLSGWQKPAEDEDALGQIGQSSFHSR